MLREWIETGNATVLTDEHLTGWIARLFLERQAISMPRFSSLAPDEIDLLADYVIALNRFGPLDARGLARYANATAANYGYTPLGTLASPLASDKASPIIAP